jgi:6,7-dimethyl-8-ribityllumazine synthase
MLKRVKKAKIAARGATFAIVASRYNARYVEAMLRAAKVTIEQAGGRVRIYRVPGAYEIPIVAARLARLANQPGGVSDSSPVSAIICLGVILRGETVHAAHIGDAVSRGLMEIQLRHEVPVIHEVLLLENEDQARKRCLGKTHNRGAEAAETALAMASLMRQLG